MLIYVKQKDFDDMNTFVIIKLFSSCVDNLRLKCLDVMQGSVRRNQGLPDVRQSLQSRQYQLPIRFEIITYLLT